MLATRPSKTRLGLMQEDDPILNLKHQTDTRACI